MKKKKNQFGDIIICFEIRKLTINYDILLQTTFFEEILYKYIRFRYDKHYIKVKLKKPEMHFCNFSTILRNEKGSESLSSNPT
jgi:hypothetical protein